MGSGKIALPLVLMAVFLAMNAIVVSAPPGGTYNPPDDGYDAQSIVDGMMQEIYDSGLLDEPMPGFDGSQTPYVLMDMYGWDTDSVYDNLEESRGWYDYAADRIDEDYLETLASEIKYAREKHYWEAIDILNETYVMLFDVYIDYSEKAMILEIYAAQIQNYWPPPSGEENSDTGMIVEFMNGTAGNLSYTDNESYMFFGIECTRNISWAVLVCNGTRHEMAKAADTTSVYGAYFNLTGLDNRTTYACFANVTSVEGLHDTTDELWFTVSLVSVIRNDVVNESNVGETEPPGEEVNISDEEEPENTSIVNEDDAVIGDEANGTGVEGGEQENATDGLNRTEYFPEYDYSARKNTWIDAGGTEEMRSTLSEEYDKETAVWMNVEENETRMTVSGVDAGTAVRIVLGDYVGEYSTVNGSYNVSGTTERKTSVAVTAVDISVAADIDGVTLDVRNLGSPKPSGAIDKEAYQYIEIETMGLDDGVTNDVGISFRVEKSWMEGRLLKYGDISLYRQVDGLWVELPTVFVGEDGVNAHFESLSPGLSYFVIGITGAASTPIEVEIPGSSPDAQGGMGTDDDITRIKFNWEFVLIVLVVVIVLAVLKYAHGARKRSGDSGNGPRDLDKELADCKDSRNEALKRYYKREITKEQMTSILNDIKKDEFQLEMELKRRKEKGAPRAPAREA